MKILRYMRNGKENYGLFEENKIWEIKGEPFGEYTLAGISFSLNEVKLLPPCTPSKVVAVGLNYIDHIREFGGQELPKNPTIFIKLPHTVVGPEDPIVIPRGATRVDYEAELAVVIRKTCRNVRPEEASDYLLGATCLNDVTERDIQKADGQWTRAKNYDTFCPIGPWIVSGIDFGCLDIKLILNGEVKQSSNTSNLIWNVQQLVSFISEVMPLYPGDIVTTGTPSGVGPMKENDVVEVVIEGIGVLRNKVVNAASG